MKTEKRIQKNSEAPALGLKRRRGNEEVAQVKKIILKNLARLLKRERIKSKPQVQKYIEKFRAEKKIDKRF